MAQIYQSKTKSSQNSNPVLMPAKFLFQLFVKYSYIYNALMEDDLIHKGFPHFNNKFIKRWRLFLLQLTEHELLTTHSRGRNKKPRATQNHKIFTSLHILNLQFNAFDFSFSNLFNPSVPNFDLFLLIN